MSGLSGNVFAIIMFENTALSFSRKAIFREDPFEKVFLKSFEICSNYVMELFCYPNSLYILYDRKYMLVVICIKMEIL